MTQATMIGIDLAKNIFQLHGVDEKGAKIYSKKLPRSKVAIFMANIAPCTVVMEACASSHFWARKFSSMGHVVKLVSPQFVKPFLKSNKNDANDAEAIVEAGSRPSMRFVPVKSTEQQDVLCLHRVRQRVVHSRTALANEIRGLLGEYGITICQGIKKLRKQLPEILEADSEQLSVRTRHLFHQLWEELKQVDERVKNLEGQINYLADSNSIIQKLLSIPGVGVLTATAMLASIGDGHDFKNGRCLSAWLGLVPRQNSSGGKSNLGRISKRGDNYLRMLLIHGARSILWRIDRRDDPQAEWLKQLLERRGFNKACVALANKNARIIWAIISTGETYKLAS